MRTVTIEKTILKYNELNEEQKRKVIEKLYDLNTNDSYWHESVIEDYTTILEILGFRDIKIYFSGFYSQGDGACFTGRFYPCQSEDEMNSRLNKLRGYAPWDDDLYKLARNILNSGYNSEDDISRIDLYHRGHYYHEYSMHADDAGNDAFIENCRDIAKMIYNSLYKQHDYLSSREAIEETIEANDYEFDSDTLKISIY
jgi:hypothetical protein